MKKVLLTGGTGFLGAYILRYLLAKGYQVRAMRRSSSPMQLIADVADQVEWVEGDVLDFPFVEEVMQGIDQVYHAAAIVSFNPKDAAKMIQSNSEGTANMVNAALSAGVEKFLQVSSIAALGRKENQVEVNENSLWENSKNNSNYAISKFKSECEVWRGIQEGLNAVIINPSMIMGAGFWHSGTPKMFWQVAKGLSFYPKGTTGFVDVRDVAKIAIALMESDIKGERFVVNAENWAYKDLFSNIAKGLGKNPPSYKMPAWMVELAWRLDKLRSQALGVDPVLTRELTRNLQLTYRYNNEKLIKALNYEFISVEQCLADTAKAFIVAKEKDSPFGLLPLI